MFAVVRGWRGRLLQLVLPVSALAALAMFANVERGGQSDFREDPPYEPVEALAALEVAEGFKVETFAAEPLIADPVDMMVDEDGRLYVVEMPGYPLDTGGTGRVMRLMDTDGDAYPDTSVVFADGFTLPTGIMRWKDGVLVTDAPDVIYLEDRDGDGKADNRQVVLTGFALSNPQHNFNNPLYGIDNSIYLANNGPIYTTAHADRFGDFGSSVHFPDRPEGPALARNASGRNVRFHPDTGLLEELSGASQFGHAFDPWGRHFLVSNARHQFHEVIAARYLRRNPGLPVREAVAYTSYHGNPAEVFPVTIGPEHQLLTDRGVFTSAAGLTYYTGGGFPEPFDRVTFVTESVHNLVHADVVEDAGATFTAKRLYEGKEFLASTDSWFRPVNTYVGPDGALYIVDYYRKIVEHPEWMDEETILSGQLYDGNDRGRIYRISAEGAPEADWLDAVDMTGMSDGDLAGLLGHGNGWWRMHAQRLLVGRQAIGVGPVLAHMVRGGESALARLHALWALQGLGLLEADVLRAAFSDAHPGVRAQAVRLTEILDETYGAAIFENDLIAMVDDADPKVRFQLLLTLGDLSTDQAAAARDRLLERDMSDPWVQMASLTAGVTPNVEAIVRAVQAFGDRVEGRSYIRRVAALTGVAGAEADIRGTIRFALAPEDNSNSEVLEGLADGLARRTLRGSGGGAPGIDSEGLLHTFYEETDQDIRRGLLALLRHAAPFDADPARAMVLAASPAEPTARRTDMLALVEMSGAGEVVPALRDLVTRSASEAKVQEAAVRVLGSTHGDAVGRFLLDAYPRLSAGARGEALNALLRSESRMHLLLDAVEAGDISRLALGWNRRVRLMRDTEGAVKTRARSLLRATDASRVDVMRSYEAALNVSGDAGRGQAVYFSVCARCHGLAGSEAAGSNALFGPDLGTVRHWPSRALLEAILIPERTIADGYELWRLERRGEAPVTGVIRAETPSSVTLITEEGREEVTLRAEIKMLRRLDASSMPAGLEEEIGIQEMADLLEFLRR